jgi:membrane protein YqaA with SNARE-associated domain
MIVPMVVAKKDDYIKIFLIATLFSAAGGLFGYFLGSFFLEASMYVIEIYNYEEKVYALQDKLSTRGGGIFWLGVLFIAGFTPLPFKVFTITSGVIGFNLLIFFLICLLSRGLRFFIVAYFSYKFGHKFGKLLEKKGVFLFSVIGLAIVTIAVFIYFLIK